MCTLTGDRGTRVIKVWLLIISGISALVRANETVAILSLMIGLICGVEMIFNPIQFESRLVIISYRIGELTGHLTVVL